MLCSKLHRQKSFTLKHISYKISLLQGSPPAGRDSMLFLAAASKLWVFGGGGTLHPAPCTLHPAFCILHPAPCTLHPAPCTLHPTPCTMHPGGGKSTCPCPAALWPVRANPWFDQFASSSGYALGRFDQPCRKVKGGFIQFILNATAHLCHCLSTATRPGVTVLHHCA